MKNSLNIVLVAIVFIVLGCKCQKTLDDISRQAQTSPSPYATSSPSSSPSSTSSPSSSNSSGLSMATFDSLQNGMTFEEVNEKIGFKGTETFASGTGSRKVMSVKWEGDDYKIITAVFSGNKMTNKYQANLK